MIFPVRAVQPKRPILTEIRFLPSAFKLAYPEANPESRGIHTYIHTYITLRAPPTSVTKVLFIFLVSVNTCFLTARLQVLGSFVHEWMDLQDARTTRNVGRYSTYTEACRVDCSFFSFTPTGSKDSFRGAWETRFL